jgi:hypothetical protein
MKKLYALFIALLIVSSAKTQTGDPCDLCLPDGIEFTSQIQIDSFPINYPNCSEIGGSVSIHGNDITNLLSLSSLTRIDGVLSIAWYSGQSNPLLETLNGLDNLTYIGGLHIVGAGALNDITSLMNITTIGGDLEISGTYVLSSLEGLNNVTTISGNIRLFYNPLENINGIENIDAGSIVDLEITNNYYLDECNVHSICNYLAAPNGTVEISNNAPGCNTLHEVEEACGITYLEETNILENIIIYPNPANHTISLGSQAGIELTSLEILDMQGRVLMHEVVTNDNYTFKVSNLPQGLYFIRLNTNKGIEEKKLVIQ